jgi:hypothetical protein
MKNMSIPQEFMVCAVNSKGVLTGVETEKIVNFLIACLLEMRLEGIISIADKKIDLMGDLPENLNYLGTLYDYLDERKPVKIEKVIDAFCVSATKKTFGALFNDVGRSLEKEGVVSEVKVGLFKKRTGFVPAKETIVRVINMIRSELLEDGVMSEDASILAILLNNSNSLKNYFSKFEQKDIKEKLKEIDKTEAGAIAKEMLDYFNAIIATIVVIAAAS